MNYNTYFRSMAAGMFLAFALTSQSQASEFIPVTLAPMQHHAATLRVIDTTGASHDYSVAQLEEFPTYQIITTTPWREQAAVFEGIRLTDLLAAHGLSSIEGIEVIAENDYATRIEKSVWETDAILIATRVDGMPHTRRDRGPIQFVVPHDADDPDAVIGDRHLVWMASVIKPSQ